MSERRKSAKVPDLDLSEATTLQDMAQAGDTRQGDGSRNKKRTLDALERSSD